MNDVRKSTLRTEMASNGKELKTRLENMMYSFKVTRKKQIMSLFAALLILISGFTVACGVLPGNTSKENETDSGRMEDLYELKGTYIGDNSRVGKIIALLDFPEELETNGMELFTKEEPFGLEINFEFSEEMPAEYMDYRLNEILRNDDILKQESLILFSLIDNLDYVQYVMEAEALEVSIFYMDRGTADSLTMSTLGNRVSDVTRSKKQFKEFYSIYGFELKIETNQSEVYEEYIYTFNERTFTFLCPKEGWIVEEQPAWEASEGIEASPDWGVHLYKEGDKENYISLFDSVSPFTIPDFAIEKEFIVDGTKKGTIHMNWEDSFMDVYLVYDSDDSDYYHNAIVKTTEEFYEEYQDIIWHVLASLSS